MPCSINLDEVSAINSERLNLVARQVQLADEFVNEVYVPDLLAVASFYKDWTKWGGGLKNYLAYGEFPTKGYSQVDAFKIPRGVVLGRDLTKVHPVNPRDPSEIQEFITHSWYDYDGGDAKGLHPWAGETNIHYTGPKPPFEQLDVASKYSYIKTPRWKETPMEVGPLSRLIVGYAAGRADIKEAVDQTLGKLGAPKEALFSTLGRTAARGIDCILSMNYMKEFFAELMDRVKGHETSTFNGEKWEPKSWPADAEGVGLAEAPRGALAHFIKIHNGAIENYQMVVPTTWNGSPRDGKQQRSAFEESLVGTPVARLDQPLEILRTIHSFDPCVACSVHFYDPAGKHLHQVSFE